MNDDLPLSVVFVHGSWHGPWCWDKVRGRLESRGVRTFAPSLPSTGPDPSRLGTFDDDVDSLRTTLDASGPALVCSHSYGGLVSGAVHHPNARHLVFLTAFMADEGEDWSAVASDEEPTLVASALRFDSYGNVLVDPEIATACFYADCPKEDVTAALARLTPQSTEPFARPMPKPSWRTVPSTFVVCEFDQTISPRRQEAMAVRADHVIRLASSHSAMLSHPDEVADIVERLARSHFHPHA